MPAASVAKVVNPTGLLPYAGPTGSLKGVVRVSGDPVPPPDPDVPAVPSSCQSASAFYGKLFREGPGRTLADALVTVSDYGARYLPASAATKNITVQDCHWESRTFALVFGQALAVINAGSKPHVPQLLGANAPANLVSLARGEPIKLLPMRPGYVTLQDMMNLFLRADVFVLKYPTFAVTGLDGRYEIRGIPPQEVSVNAFSPQATLLEQKRVRIVAGQTTELDFVLRFDAQARAKARAAPSAGSSGHPATSASPPLP
jgi:hypothetical protein